MLGYIKKGMETSTGIIIMSFHKSRLHPHVEYSTAFQSLFRKKQLKKKRSEEGQKTYISWIESIHMKRN